MNHVLEGSVRKAGNRLRITAQLTETATDHHVWAERYDRNLEDVFAVQDEVARSVSAALAVALNADEHERLGRPSTESIAAYDSAAIELWLVLFMVLGGMSFILYTRLLRREWARWKAEAPV